MAASTKLTHDEQCGFCPLPYIKTTLVREYGQEKPLRHLLLSLWVCEYCFRLEKCEPIFNNLYKPCKQAKW